MTWLDGDSDLDGSGVPYADGDALAVVVGPTGRGELHLNGKTVAVSTKRLPLPVRVRLLVRVPDGSKPERRFRVADKLRLLFDFVESLTANAPSSAGGSSSSNQNYSKISFIC